MRTLFLIKLTTAPVISSHGGSRVRALSGVSYKGTNPIHEASILMTKSPPKGPHPNACTSVVRISTCKFLGGHSQSIADSTDSIQIPWSRLIHLPADRDVDGWWLTAAALKEKCHQPLGPAAPSVTLLPRGTIVTNNGFCRDAYMQPLSLSMGQL